ncbi:DMT family transporter [Leptolyngbya sp. FACHB-36]|uniref:DMT family transporter n=1 Tax=Leptolyngbya sp. FACHB-36 TaxID=2692808 RepID=UPI00168048D3|nr:DMT family transporter [Leptolyngbya sp. FACHB-36]MBD2018769.1 DMT family transporter [Leptolyngbya sp. FACHB-36]
MVVFLAEFRGELAALGAAAIWAVASIVYTQVGRQLSPLMLNLVKGCVAIVLLVLTLLLRGELLPQVSTHSLGLLLLSGAIGIGFGDTAYFQALNRIGPRRSLVLEALAPPLAAVLAAQFLNEQLQTGAWAGIALTIVGVVWVVVERTPEIPQATSLSGVGFGVLAAVGQAGGAVLSRAALLEAAVDPLWSTFIRLAAGVLVLLVWRLLQRRSPQDLKPLRSPQLALTIAATAFASTYLAIWLQQLSLKYAPTGIAQSLSATSPLFVTAIALAMGNRVSARAILGVVVALGGIWLLFGR